MTPKLSSAGRSGSTLDAAGIARVAEQAETMPPDDRRRIAASVAMFERLADHWSLRADDRETLLGGISKSTWSEWRQRPASARIKVDTRERVANLFTIDLNAHALFAPEFADRWVREPNAAFAGQSPLSTMLRGRIEDIIGVRHYLERIRTSSAPDAAGPGITANEPKLAVSYLPGTAIEPGEDAALSVLREAVAIYEQLGSDGSSQYQPGLASALRSLATCLDERNDPESLAVARRAAAVGERVLREQPAYAIDMLGVYSQLRELLTKSGDRAEAKAVSMKARRVYTRAERFVNPGTA